MCWSGEDGGVGDDGDLQEMDGDDGDGDVHEMDDDGGDDGDDDGDGDVQERAKVKAGRETTGEK